VGDSASPSNRSVTVGTLSASALPGDLAIGEQASADGQGDGAIAIGREAAVAQTDADGTAAIAIGRSAQADGDGAIAIGQGVTVTDDGVARIGSAGTAVEAGGNIFRGANGSINFDAGAETVFSSSGGMQLQANNAEAMTLQSSTETADGMTADPESGAEDAYLSVQIGANSYQIPLYNA
jgi:hypothetical protein